MSTVEKTEEQIARDKAAVEAMRNAKSNMDTALSRIAALESALAYARDNLVRTKGYIGAANYTYPSSGNAKTVHATIDDMVAHATKALG